MPHQSLRQNFNCLLPLLLCQLLCHCLIVHANATDRLLLGFQNVASISQVGVAAKCSADLHDHVLGVSRAAGDDLRA